jgi:hypothetical protein
MTVEMQQISPKAKEICKQMLRAKTEGKKIYHTSARQKRFFTYNYTLEF